VFVRSSPNRRHLLFGSVALAGTALSLFGLPRLSSADPLPFRVGHFPNITHLQALVAHACHDRAAAGSNNVSDRMLN